MSENVIEAVLVQWGDEGPVEWTGVYQGALAERQLAWGMADGSVRWKDPR